MRRHACVGLVGVAAAVVLACGDDLGPRIPAAIAVTPEAPQVPVAGTLQLAATVVDESGQGDPRPHRHVPLERYHGPHGGRRRSPHVGGVDR